MKDLKELENHIIQLVLLMRESAKQFSDCAKISDHENSLTERICVLRDIKKLQQNKAKPIGEITGIDTAALPPLKKMNDAQATFLTHEMIRLLNAFRIYPEFPKKLPDHIKYLTLCEIWKERIVDISNSEVYLVFCNDNSVNCPFPDDYCRCSH